MEVIVIESLAYEKLKQELFDFIWLKLEERERAVLKKSSQQDWVDVPTAMKLLNIRRTKLQQMKNNGEIHFMQNKKKLLFSRKSIEAYMLKHSTY